MKIATLYFNNVRLKPSQIHKLRGYVGNAFKNHDLIHNHDLTTGKVIYRYPLIQFKLIDNVPAIIAITEHAVKIFGEIFMQLDRIRIEGLEISVHEKNLKVDDVEFGFSNETFMYEFVSPWIGLNQKNYLQYRDANKGEKQKILQSAFIGNILAMAKGVGYWLEKEQRLESELQVRECPVNLKGRTMKGFKGRVQTNFMIPDHMGLGKSVSRGFGVVKGAM
ncbi:hypothetical protein DSCO28_27000 [Desulfosarcina ovata subsp. sediminis]|uniref:DNA repair protein n=1 Tax=Desulfosarcina ovata subsp. sediminis TaxID=885957 RepID=A0A5K7ZL69_9BACT|nr:CRISPR-associated endonuclease Cas6 [Desulfosarcina ovata]BBO82134.1 hypothetical protein DSCO28_27000 [Desulfosarcina ovata subsp. sediminis]